MASPLDLSSLNLGGVGSSSEASRRESLGQFGRMVSSVRRLLGSRAASEVMNSAPLAEGLKRQALAIMTTRPQDFEGGYARIWLVKNVPEGEVVYAIKAAKKESEGTPSHEIMQNELFREAVALKCLKHPNIVELLGTCQHPSLGIILVQGLMDGSLHELFEELEGIPVTTVHHIGCDVSAGLRFIHHQHLTHGDLQEGNVLYRKEEKGTFSFRIADFGSSSRVGERRPPSGNVYLPPEVSSYWKKQFSAHFVSKPSACTESDVWAFGAMILRLLLVVSPAELGLWISRLARISIEEERETEAQCLERMSGLAVREQKLCREPVPDNLRDWVHGVLRAMSGCLSLRLESRPSIDEVNRRLQDISLRMVSPGKDRGGKQKAE
ncbi:protein kinase family protein [Sansalvadorimonas verongulae]|uniref:protein kinase family protein n=1 Tax=Sansalvadorimonas verongulae TaxID=2172824 RepID=UPI0012BD34CC|nr:protein kinase family protein [Sansalvadorimonas verongulae]MTI14249.1 protein kinase family protein [Sansalvadorimonas verongulae]